jgi:hypothetical protein
MKPFITPEITTSGKKFFPYQCEGVESAALWRCLEGRRLVAYSLPEGHTLQASWELSLVFDSYLVLEFSSACSQAIDWQEVGSLNIRLVQSSLEGGAMSTIDRSEDVIPEIDLVAVERLIFEDEDVVVECGLVLCGRYGEEVVVAAGVSPGSISVKASFSVEECFEPQFPLSACRRLPI